MSDTRLTRREMLKQSAIIKALGVPRDFRRRTRNHQAHPVSEKLPHRQPADSARARHQRGRGFLGRRLAGPACRAGAARGWARRDLHRGPPPYGVQADEPDAAAAVAAIRPDPVITMDIKPAADSVMAAVLAGGTDPGRRHHFILGNVKARQRMIAQYAIAGIASGLVIGTDHAAEALMGFYPKFGDGAADVLPLSGLNKRRVRAVAATLGAPDPLVWKVPTADLESDAPLRPNEEVYGVTYDQIDDFLEGRAIEPAAAERIVSAYKASAHKRALPVPAR
jgi:NAD+ synthase